MSAAFETLLSQYLCSNSDDRVSTSFLEYEFVLNFLNFVHTSLQLFCNTVSSKSKPVASSNGNGHYSEQDKISHFRYQQPHASSPESVCSQILNSVEVTSPRLLPTSKRGPQSKNNHKDATQHPGGTIVKTKHMSEPFNLNISSPLHFPTLKNVEIKNAPNIRKKASRRINTTLVTLPSQSSKKPVFNPDVTASSKPNTTQHPNDDFLQRRMKSEFVQANNQVEDNGCISGNGFPAIADDTSVIQLDTSVDSASTKMDVEHVNSSDLVKLKRLSGLYCIYVCEMHLSSIVTEVQILIDVLSSDFEHLPPFMDIGGFSELGKIFFVTKNIVHFAGISFESILKKGIAKLFTTSTIVLLANELSSKTMELLRDSVSLLKVEIETRKKSKLVDENKVFSDSNGKMCNVPFQPETDNRNSFQSDKAFGGFRKQRDMFYSLLREWEKPPKKNIRKDAVDKYSWLLSQIRLLSTYKSFTRLFVDQLIEAGSCKSPKLWQVNSSKMPSASGFGDAEKLRKLETRVITPSHSDSLRSHQFQYLAFFKDFVQNADSYSLIVRLCDAICQRIFNIEEECLLIGDNNLSLINMRNILQVLSNLRNLGHFYGFLIFMPYSDDDSGEGHMFSHAFRCMQNAVESSLRKKHLIVTIPWVVQVLLFTPAIIRQTPPFKQIMNTLIDIYKSPQLRGGDGVLQLFVSTTISCLFDDLGSDLFYQHRDTRPISYEFAPNSIDGSTDKLLRLSEDLMQDANWRLAEISALLKSRSFCSSSRKSLPVKKITPLSEKLPDNSVGIQEQLTVHFFRNQPASLKRTVTFVADRCHSMCVKHICSTFLPAFCADLRTESQNSEVNSVTIRELSDQVFPAAMCAAKRESRDFVTSNADKCITALVASTLPKQVVEVATQITIKQSLQNVTSWLRERMFDHLHTRVKLLLSQPGKAEETSGGVGTIELSELIHSVRELIIGQHSDEQRVATADSDKQEKVGELVAVMSTQQHPPHLTPVLTFLLRELVATADLLTPELDAAVASLLAR